MPKAKILFADNDKDFLDTYASILKNEGYIVFEANTLESAQDLLKQGKTDLAILDVRMVDNKRKPDTSGLLLAEINPSIPKIIFTGYASFDIARAALISPTKEKSLAFSVIGKGEGPAILLSKIKEILKWKQNRRFRSIIACILLTFIGFLLILLPREWITPQFFALNDPIWTGIGAIANIVGVIFTVMGVFITIYLTRSK